MMKAINVYPSKRIIYFLKKVNNCRIGISIEVLSCLLLLIFPSCQKDELDKDYISVADITSFSELSLTGSATYYYRTGTFEIDFTQSLQGKRYLFNQDFKYFENFILHVQNGINNKTIVSKIEIRIDGVLIVNTSDFDKRENIVSKAITGLTNKSVLDVYISGVEGSFIELLIEGTAKEGMEGIVTDVDGNYYHTVTIGDQVWMVENLKTTRYNDGTEIPLVTNNKYWGQLTTSGYCWYNNDKSGFKTVYGALYNWNAVNTGYLCPTGWHVPNDVEWTALTTFSGGMSVAGSKLKETGTTHWLYDNTVSTNESGFTALPGGFRLMENFASIGSLGMWWSSSEFSPDGLPYLPEESGRHLEMNNSFDYTLLGNVLKLHGLSVRCIKD